MRWTRFLRSYSKFSYANQETILKSAADFGRIIGFENLSRKEAIRCQFSRDEGWHRAWIPDLVLSPRNVEHVSACLALCHERRIPVVPFGTGTGLEGGSVSIMAGVVMDMHGMDEVTRVNVDDFDCSVQPGVTRGALDAHLKSTGLFFPVDPGADASLCGMAATGASGTTTVRYGTMKENVIAMQVVLADGTIVDTRGRGNHPAKTAAGLNLTELFVGSEGILGIITEVTLRLYARPNAVSAAVCNFPSITDAIKAVVEVLQNSVPIARIEFLDTAQVIACNAYSKLTLPEKPHLFLEFHGATDTEVTKQSATVGDICASNNGSSFAYSTELSQRQRLWKARHSAYYAALSMCPGKRGISTDVCVPISKLGEVVAATHEDLQTHGIFGPIVGHVGDGNFHVILACHDSDPEEKKKLQAFIDRLASRAISVGGTCTGEHGIGIGKRHLLEQEVGPGALNTMRAIKAALDPHGIMNPGKVV